MDWIESFAGPNITLAAPVIPNASDYPPPEGCKLSATRQDVFSHLFVLVVSARDEEYVGILKKCGAVVHCCWDATGAGISVLEAAKKAVRTAARSHANRNITIFLNDTGGVVDSTLESLSVLGLPYFTMGNMALSVLSLEPPNIATDLHSSHTISAMLSQSQSAASQSHGFGVSARI